MVNGEIAEWQISKSKVQSSEMEIAVGDGIVGFRVEIGE